MKIGVDIGGTKIAAGVVVHKRVTKKIISPLKSKKKEKVLEQLYDILDGLEARKASHIGIGVPTIVHPKTQVLVETPHISSWKRVDLRKLIQKKYGVKTTIENDGNCFVKGLNITGGERNVLGVVLGTGVGSGIIIKGELYRGHDGIASEIGKLPYKNKTFEDYCSGTYLRNTYKKKGEDLSIAAKGGDKEARNAFATYGKNVGDLMAATIHLYNPERIVIGGSVAESFPYFKKAMNDQLKNYPFMKYASTKISVAKNKDLAIIGAAHLEKKS